MYDGVALQLKERTKDVFVAPRFLVPGLFSFWTDVQAAIGHCLHNEVFLHEDLCL